MKKILLNFRLLLILLLAISTQVYANSECYQNVQISLDNNGIASVNSSMISTYPVSSNILLSKDNINYYQELEFNCDAVGDQHIIYVKNLDDNEICTSTVEFFDKHHPIIYCLNLSTALLDNSSVTLYAVDFDKESFDNCTAQEDLLFTFGSFSFNFPEETINGLIVNKSIPQYFDENGPISAVSNASQDVIDSYNSGKTQRWHPSSNSSSRVFTTIGQEVISMSITDESGNSNYCTIQLTLVGTNLHCVEQLSVSLDDEGKATVAAPLFASTSSTQNVEVSLDGINFLPMLTFDCGHLSDEIDVIVRMENSTEICTSTVKIYDNTPPIVVTKDTSFDLDDPSDIINLKISDLVQSSYDNCDSLEITILSNALDIYDLGDNTIKIVATDDSGNISLAFANVYLTLNGNPYATICHNNVELSTNPWVCSRDKIVASDLYIGNAVHDSSKVSLDNEVFYDFIEDFPIGEITVYVETIDDGIATYCESTVNIIDKIPPVIVATQGIVVSLISGSTSESIAKIFADEIDNGSHDACTSVFVEIRRESDPCGFRGNTTFNADGHPNDGSSNPLSPDYDADDGKFVKFCCSDLTDISEDGTRFGFVTVWTRGWDLNGNYNETWTSVKVEEKITPEIQCPPDITITCDMDSDDLTLTGEAAAYSACGNIGTNYKDVIVNIDACGVGFKIRRWDVDGLPGTTCDQRIDVIIDDSFDGNINWPVDIEIEDVSVETGAPTWTQGSCDLIGYSSTCDTLEIIADEQYQITKQWVVVDWCRYEPNFPDQDPNNNGVQDGIWRHDQIIIVNLTTYQNLVKVNTISNRPLSGVLVNNVHETDTEGNVFVIDEDVSSIELTDERLNGINILDWIQIQSHILKINEFDDDYQLISADLNEDNKVNAADLILLKNQLLGIDDVDPNWKFVNKLEDINSTFKPKGNYIAYKSGDVDDSTLLDGESLPNESNSVTYNDILLNNGQSYELPIYIRDQINIKGLEIRMQIDLNKIIINNLESDFFFNWHLTPSGELTLLFYDSSLVPMLVGGEQSDDIFTIHFTSLENTILHLAVSEQIIPSFAASEELELIVLGLNSDGEIIDNVIDHTFDGISVYPNPAHDYLMINHSKLEIKGPHNVSIYNTKGQLVLQALNPERIDLTTLNAGLYFYQIEINGHVYTNKLSIIK